MRKKRKNKTGFVMLPRWFVETSLISSREKYFCLILAYHRNSKNKRCDPSIPLIGLEAGLSERTIKTYRKKLVELNIISFKPGTDRKNRAKYELKWLDGSDEEIVRLKKLFKSNLPVQNSRGLTSAKQHPLTSAKQHPLTSAKEQGELELKKQQRKKQQQRDVGASSPQETKPLKPTNHTVELFNLGINWLDRCYIDSGWEEATEKAKKRIVQGAIIKAKRDISHKLVDYLRDWKKEIDRHREKPIHNKVGLMIRLAEEGRQPPHPEEDPQDQYRDYIKRDNGEIVA